MPGGPLLCLGKHHLSLADQAGCPRAELQMFGFHVDFCQVFLTPTQPSRWWSCCVKGAGRSGLKRGRCWICWFPGFPISNHEMMDSVSDYEMTSDHASGILASGWIQNRLHIKNGCFLNRDAQDQIIGGPMCNPYPLILDTDHSSKTLGLVWFSIGCKYV